MDDRGTGRGWRQGRYLAVEVLLRVSDRLGIGLLSEDAKALVVALEEEGMLDPGARVAKAELDALRAAARDADSPFTRQYLTDRVRDIEEGRMPVVRDVPPAGRHRRRRW